MDKKKSSEGKIDKALDVVTKINKASDEAEEAFEKDGLRAKKGFLGVSKTLWFIAIVIGVFIKYDEIKQWFG